LSFQFVINFFINYNPPVTIICSCKAIYFPHNFPFKRQQQHLILLSLLSTNFNNFVTLEGYEVKIPWLWCRCIETFRSAYDI
jgi:hypothetical protein